MKNEKWDNLISEILEKIQDGINGKVGIIRETPQYSFFEPILKITIDDKRLDINLPYYFVEELYYFGSSALPLSTTELAYAVLYEIRKSYPEYINQEGIFRWE